MYAVGFINLGVFGMHNPCGNSGLKKLQYKTMSGWNKELQVMKKNVDEIFIMNDFTQKMCEMTQSQLWEYCYKNKVARL